MRPSSAPSTSGGRPTTAVPRQALLAGALVAALGSAGCGAGSEKEHTVKRDRNSMARPGYVPAASTDVTTAPRRLDRPLPAGSVTVVAGPFSDRVQLSRLRFTPSRARPVVSGRAVNVADVSEVIVFEVRADFYDRHGRPVGSGAQVFQNADAFDHEAEAIHFTIQPTASARRAVAATISIPQLVNE